MFWLFGHEARGILAPQPATEPAPPALEGKVLITGPPGKSLNFLNSYNIVHILNSFWSQILLLVSVENCAHSI